MVAHPDDIDFGCAGTVAWLTDAGVEVALLFGYQRRCWRRQRRINNIEASRAKRIEQTNAANIVGVNKIHFLRQPDGRIESNLELREK